MTDNTILYCLEYNGRKTYILGALDSGFLGKSLVRPEGWDAQVTDLFHTIQPSTVTTLHSMQDCYDLAQNGTVVSGLNRYTLSSSSTASIALRAALQVRAGLGQNPNRNYTFKGLMTRPSYYSFCAIHLTRFVVMPNVLPHLPKMRFTQWERTLAAGRLGLSFIRDRIVRLRTQYGIKALEFLSQTNILTSLSFLRSSKILKKVVIFVLQFITPLRRVTIKLYNVQDALKKKFPFVHLALSVLCAIGIVVGLNILIPAILSSSLLPLTLQMFLPPIVMGAVNLSFLSYGLYKLSQNIGAVASFISRFNPWAQPFVQESFATTQSFFNQCCYFISESFFAREEVTSTLASKIWISSDDDQPWLFAKLSGVGQYVADTWAALMGYSASFHSQPFNMAANGRSLDASHTNSAEYERNNANSPPPDQQREGRVLETDHLPTNYATVGNPLRPVDQHLNSQVELIILPASLMAGQGGVIEKLKTRVDRGDYLGCQLKPCLFKWQGADGQAPRVIYDFDSLESMRQHLNRR